MIYFITFLLFYVSYICIYYPNSKYIGSFFLYICLVSFLFPYPIFNLARNIYLSDIFLTVLMILYSYSYFQKVKHFGDSKKLIIILVNLLIIIPFFTTVVAYNLGNINNLGNVFIHFFRATVVIFSFLWGLYLGYYFNKLYIIMKIFIFTWIIILLIGILEYLNLIDTNVYFTGVFSGFFGLDKPQIALFTVNFFLIIIFIYKDKISLLSLGLILSFFIILAIGSRQGLIYLILSCVLFIFYKIKYQFINFIKFYFIPTLIFTSALSFFVIPMLDERFSSILHLADNNESWILSLFTSRDPQFLNSWDYLIEDSYFFIGHGLGTENSGYVQNELNQLIKDPFSERTYFEGEFFRVLWSSGIVGVFLYLSFYFYLGKSCFKAMFSNPNFKTYSYLLLSLLLINFLFGMGQFGIFTTDGQNIPFIYFILFLYGIIYSSINKLKYVN